MPGYDRQYATGLGVGAGEIVHTLGEHLRDEDPLRIGSVLRPYERSAYLTVRADLTASLPFRGPRLLLVGTRGLSGPLTIAVDDGSARGFDPGDIETDATCQLRTATTSTRDDTRYVLVVGDTLEVTIERNLLDPDETETIQIRDLSDIDRGSPCWLQAADTLDWLLKSEFEDGLGWGARLQACVSDEGGDAELQNLAASWNRCVAVGLDEELPPVIGELVGRGPGATPSGDDILSGILLTLLHTTSGEHYRRVQATGETLVTVANDRTTTISTALLAQAVLGRAPDSVVEAVASLLRPTVPQERRDTAARTVAARGHTSGVDILLGILLTILLVGPRFEG